MARIWIAERIRQVLKLPEALIKRKLPGDVRYEEAEVRQAQLKGELYRTMAAEPPGSREAARQLTDAGQRLAELRERAAGGQA